jgi:RNA polymerase sigma-70 factor (ECF subfamily)
VRAWEAGDVAAIAAMLTDDATFAMPPRPTWFRGRTAVGAFLAARPLARRREWRLVPARANGQPALGFYLADRAGGEPLAHAIEVLTLDGDARISAVTSFHQPEAFARFGLPGALAP